MPGLSGSTMVPASLSISAGTFRLASVTADTVVGVVAELGELVGGEHPVVDPEIAHPALEELVAGVHRLADVVGRGDRRRRSSPA